MIQITALGYVLADIQQNALLLFSWCWEPALTLPSIQPTIPCRSVHLLFLDLEAILETTEVLTPIQSLIQQMFPSPSQHTHYKPLLKWAQVPQRCVKAAEKSQILQSNPCQSHPGWFWAAQWLQCIMPAGQNPLLVFHQMRRGKNQLVSPTDTINLRLRGNNLSVRWGMLSLQPLSLLLRETPQPLEPAERCE